MLSFLEQEKEYVKKVRVGNMDVFSRGVGGKPQNKLMIPLKTSQPTKGPQKRQKFRKRSKSNK